MHTECDAPGGEAHYNWLSVLAVDMQSRGKIHQAFWLSFCTLQAIKNWSRGKPGNEASEKQFGVNSS